MNRRHVAVVFSLLALGCSVSVAEDDRLELTQNECSADHECGAEGRCEDGMCRALEGRFSTVLFEVAAPASPKSDEFAGVSFIETRTDVPTAGGAFDLSLGHVAEISGTITAPVKQDRTDVCDWDLSAAPLKVSFTPTERLLGFPGGVYSATATAIPSQECEAESELLCKRMAKFGLRIPPGEYQVYVSQEPVEADALEQPAEEGGDEPPILPCRVVPQLYRSVAIEPGAVLDLELPQPSSLELTVRWSSSVGDFSDWTVDLIDPQSARWLSTSRVVECPASQPKPTDGVTACYSDGLKCTYDGVTCTCEADADGGAGWQCEDNVDETPAVTVELEYSPVEGYEAVPGEELVRISPPEGVVAPALLMERGAVELFPGEATIDHLAELPEPIVLEGWVEMESAEPVQATVNLVATELDSLKPGTLASYQQTLEADAEGKFRAELLPGSYRVVVVPPVDSGLAVFDDTWEVAGEPSVQAGRTVQLHERAKLVGTNA